jgi:hypothetical protein
MLELLEFVGRIALGILRVAAGLLEAVTIVGDIWCRWRQPKPERQDREAPPPET